MRDLRLLVTSSPAIRVILREGAEVVEDHRPALGMQRHVEHLRWRRLHPSLLWRRHLPATRCRVPGTEGAVPVLPGTGVSPVPAQPVPARDPGGDCGRARTWRPTDPKDMLERLHPELLHNSDGVDRRRSWQPALAVYRGSAPREAVISVARQAACRRDPCVRCCLGWAAAILLA